MTDFSEAELTKIVREAVREELADAGLRVHDEQHQDEARADFLFIRRLRGAYNSLASKVGSAIIIAIASGVLWLIWVGWQSTTK